MNHIFIDIDFLFFRRIKRIVDFIQKYNKTLLEIRRKKSF